MPIKICVTGWAPLRSNKETSPRVDVAITIPLLMRPPRARKASEISTHFGTRRFTLAGAIR